MNMVGIAQLVRASDCGSEGSRVRVPLPTPYFWPPVAQSARLHLPFKQGVRGSNPRWITRINAVKTSSFAALFLFLHNYFVGKVQFPAFFVHVKRIPVFTVFCGCRVCHLLCHLHKRKGGQTPSLLLSAVPRNNRSRVNALSVFMHSLRQMRGRAVARRAHRADAAGPRASRQ